MRLQLLATLLVSSAALAQTTCPTANLACSSGWTSGNTNIFCPILPISTAPVVVLGYTLKSSSPSSATIKFYLHLADAANKPVLPAARSGTMTMTPTYGLYSGKFTPPYVVPANTQYFISFDNTGMSHPICTTANTRINYYWRPQNATTWNGTPTSFTQAWTFRVDTTQCPPSAAYSMYGAGCKGTGPGNGIPALSHTGLPQLGKSFTVDLNNARATAAALLVLGFSDKLWAALPLPFDLTPIGAPGCKLLASGETMGGLVTSATGTAKMTFLIPNISALGGLMLFNQFIVSDPTVNTLQVVLSNGGKMTLGQ
jgi:hypothetical protein